MKQSEAGGLKLKVTEALSKDVGRALARMGPEDLGKLGVAIGDLVEVAGKRRTVCKAMPAYMELRGQSRVQLDGLSRENAGAGLDEYVQLSRWGKRILSPSVSPIPQPRYRAWGCWEEAQAPWFQAPSV